MKLMAYFLVAATLAATDEPTARSKTSETKTFKVDQSFTPIEVNLGEVFVGETLEAKITFQNQSDSQLAVIDAKTCCGCVVAIRKGERVENGAQSDFAVALAPMLVPKEFRKQITLKMESGKAWDVKLSADVKASYDVHPQRVRTPDGPGENKFSGRIRCLSNSMKDFELLPTSGFVRLTKKPVSENGSLEFSYELSVDALESTSNLVERLAIVDPKSKRTIAVLPLVIETSKQVAHRPSKLTFRQDENATFVSRGVLIGDKDYLKKLPDEGKCEIREGGKRVCTGQFKIANRTASIVSLQYELAKDSQIPSAENPKLKLLLLDKNNKALVEVESVRFSGIQTEN